MNWRIKIASFLLFLSACVTDKGNDSERKIAADTPHNTSYLIDFDEFNKRIKQANTKIIDFRKKEDYDHGHLKGALNIWRSDIEDKSYPYGGMMASRKQIEGLFSQKGISAIDTILIYDDRGLCNAARLWWILQNYGFTNVKLLDGGINEWLANNGSLTTDSTIIQASQFKLPETSTMQYFISKEEMQDVLNSNKRIIDTRTLDEFSGKRQKRGASRAGRIPGSIHIDWAEAVNYNGDNKIRSIEELKSIYTQQQIMKDDTIILYCHSGVRSAHTTFILTQMLNYKNVKNYDGSWIEWSYFNNLPVEKDSSTQFIN